MDEFFYVMIGTRYLASTRLVNGAVDGKVRLYDDKRHAGLYRPEQADALVDALAKAGKQTARKVSA